MKGLRNMKAVLAILLSVTWVPIQAQSEQALERLDRAFEAMMAKHRPDCVLDASKSSQGTHAASPENSVRFHAREWRCDGSRVELRYSVEASAQVAHEVVQRQQAISQFGEWPSVKGFADEAYVLGARLSNRAEHVNGLLGACPGAQMGPRR